MTKQLNHIINGTIIPGSSTKFGTIINPATGQEAGQVAFANQHDVDLAVQAAKDALPAWSALPANQRAKYMYKYKVLIEKHTNEIAQLVSAEHGKTISDAKASIARGLEVVEHALQVPQLLQGTYSADVASGIDCHTIRQAVGVCAGITPFNFPAMIPLWMFPIAITCGNTFVLKPSEKDPSCPMRLVELLHEAGVPAGVVNCVNGDKTTVNALLTHPDVRAVSFVGSTPIAKEIAQQAVQHHKRVQAFGGAKNHCIVMPDADLEATADAIIGAAYGSAGQRCMALSVVVAVGDDVANTLVSKMAPKVTALKIGPGTDPNVDIGPLVSAALHDYVLDCVNSGVEQGAELIVDGRHFKLEAYQNGFFMGGCLFDHVKPDMRIYQEEIFGPVLCVVRMPDYQSALELINDNPYGNGTAIFTRDGECARHFAQHVTVGMVGINVPIPVPAAKHSFGGWKNSFFGDVRLHGDEGVRFYTQAKSITTRWPSDKRHENLFTLPTHD